MGAVVLVIVVFFWPSVDKTPQATAIEVPSAVACQTAGAKARVALEAHEGVRLVQFVCLGVRGDADSD